MNIFHVFLCLIEVELLKHFLFFGFLFLLIAAAIFVSCSKKEEVALAAMVSGDSLVKGNKGNGMKEKIVKSEAEWKKLLTDEQFYIMRQKGTERPYTGEYWDLKEDGVYKCAACGEVLFVSDTKFDSHCGWPSFYEPIHSDAVEYVEDRSHGMVRTEVRCRACGGHLGHVFPDGPQPTGERFCINSLSIDLRPAEE